MIKGFAVPEQQRKYNIHVGPLSFQKRAKYIRPDFSRFCNHTGSAGTVPRRHRRVAVPALVPPIREHLPKAGSLSAPRLRAIHFLTTSVASVPAGSTVGASNSALRIPPRAAEPVSLPCATVLPPMCFRCGPWPDRAHPSRWSSAAGRR